MSELMQVWCCERQAKCGWQGFVLHQGLGWGEIPHSTEWRKWHDKECGGNLLQLLPENPAPVVCDAMVVTKEMMQRAGPAFTSAIKRKAKIEQALRAALEAALSRGEGE